MILLCCLTLLSYDLSYVGAVLGSKPIRQSAIIPLGAQSLELPFQVQWKRGNQLVGKIHNGRCVHGCNEKSQIFSNGSLFLSHVQREDEGRYLADVYNASGHYTNHVEVLLQIVDVSADQMIRPLGHSVLLYLDKDVMKPYFRVQWKRGNQLLGEVYMRKCVYGCNETNHILPNGSFFLAHLQQEDEGMYSAKVYDAAGFPIHNSEILLLINVSGVEIQGQQPKPQRLTLPAVFLICEIVIFSMFCVVMVCLGIFFWNWRKQRIASSTFSVIYTKIRRSVGKPRVEWNKINYTLDAQVATEEMGTSAIPDDTSDKFSNETPDSMDLATFQRFQD
ncbi:uncharacterized protein LOC142140559 [Mixophyes fleayi]|uniref:uncharacterized protein LOC142140559 n=1 Tax=Mixophyes fleayi TaxID=3061075 RepID=UPI003F4DD6CE